MSIRKQDDLMPKVLLEYSKGTPIDVLCHKFKISQATFYRWRKQHSGTHSLLETKIFQLELENKALKQMFADKCVQEYLS